MKIYTVTEFPVDHDNWPRGEGKVILTTTCEARAKLEVDYQRKHWSIPAGFGNIDRRLKEVELEEEDPEVIAETEERWEKIVKERKARMAEYERKAAEHKAALEEAKQAKLLEQAQAAWYTLPNPHAL